MLSGRSWRLRLNKGLEGDRRLKEEASWVCPGQTLWKLETDLWDLPEALIIFFFFSFLIPSILLYAAISVYKIITLVKQKINIHRGRH